MSDQESYNPWTIVNIVFHHLAEEGLHPVLGEAGDPAVPAAALLTAFGIEAAPDDAGPAAPPVQEVLADLRQRMFPGVEEK